MKFEDFFVSPNWQTDDGIKNLENIYNEIWTGGEYSRFGVEIKPNDIVVDCGANIGMFSQYAISRGAQKVFSFECGDEEFKYLQINTANQQNIIPIQGYISDKDYNIKRIILENNLINIDFLKVDIEGFEYDLIINEDTDFLKRVNKMAIELHIWGMFQNLGENYFKAFQLIEKLSLCGFKLNLEHIHKNTCLYMLYASK